MTFHKQVRVTVGNMSAEVDELLVPCIKKLWEHGLWTWVSCQQEGPDTKKFPMYINPFGLPEGNTLPEGFRYTHAEEMKRCLGIKNGESRVYNGVLWLPKGFLPK